LNSNDRSGRSQAQTATQEQGASLVEYSILAALICVFAIVSVKALGGKIKATFINVSQAMSGSSDVNP
jgi:Flp pilus assembly pilin Flp